MLESDELLLEYVLDDDSSTCLVIDKSIFRAVSLARGPEIESLLAVFLAEVRSKRPATEVSRELHKLLLEPVGEYTGKKRPVVVPDGKLHLLPFDALIGADGRRVLASHVVSYAPSATVLKLLRDREPKTPDLPLLAVGAIGNSQTLRPCWQLRATQRVASSTSKAPTLSSYLQPQRR